LTDLAQTELRKATIADAAAVSRLADTSYARWVEVIGSTPQPMQADYEDFIRSHEVWLTGPSNAPEGSLALKVEDEHLLLWSIAVSPTAQGKGLGGALLDFTCQRCRQLGLTEVRLFTNVRMESNRAWYERKGFQEFDRKTIGDKHVIFMSKAV
jgi:N-acetylglutamate synthase-like GNAT family acetyltransferase